MLSTPVIGFTLGIIMKVILTPLSVAMLTTSIFSSPLLTSIALAKEGAVSEIIVTANRREQPLSEIGTSISVLTDVDLVKGQYVYVLDALGSVPGVAISQSGSFGGTASVSIRGAGGDQTLVFVDGVRLNDPSSTGNGYNFANLDPHNIERMEILRGPQSVLYGSDAIGGVVNIITKSGEEDAGASVFAETGSFNTYRGGATAFGGTEKFGYNIAASGTSTDGVSSADENDGNSEKDGFEGYTLSGKLTAYPSDVIKAELIGRYSDNRSEFDSYGPIDGDKVSYTEDYLIAGRARVDLLDGDFINTFSVEHSEIERRNETAGAETLNTKGSRLSLSYLGVYNIKSRLGFDGWCRT